MNAPLTIQGGCMPKYLRNAGKPWKPSEVTMIREYAKENTPTRIIGLKLGRSASSIYTKASEKGISLSPTNQSPYNRSK
jgi:hypothetical protein